MMNIKIEPIDSMTSLSSPANVADLINGNGNQNSNSSDANNQTSAIVDNTTTISNSIATITNNGVQTNGTSNNQATVVSSPQSTIVLDKSRDLETTVISLAPAQPYPPGTAQLTFAPAYDLSGQTQYTVQVI